MTREKDVFWGIYAAALPILFGIGMPAMERWMQWYVSRSFRVLPMLLLGIGSMLLFGILLGILAVRFLGKPMETSNVPWYGLLIGFLFTAACFAAMVLNYLGIPMQFGMRMLVNGGTRLYLLLGFYGVLCVGYRRTRTFVTKAELRGEVPMAEEPSEAEEPME